MKLRTTLAAIAFTALNPLVAACSLGAADADTTTSTSTSSSSSSSASSAEGPLRGGGPGGIDVSSVATEDDLGALIQSAYGDAGLGLHRGHEPVQDVLDEVLTISHDELHVRMEEQGQNLAAVAEDIGVDPQTLIDALVASWSPAIDSLLEDGTITADEADSYRDALEQAFAFRVTWDGSEQTPTFTGTGG